MSVALGLAVLFVGFAMGLIVFAMMKTALIEETYDDGYNEGWTHAMKLMEMQNKGS